MGPRLKNQRSVPRVFCKLLYFGDSRIRQLSLPVRQPAHSELLLPAHGFLFVVPQATLAQVTCPFNQFTIERL